MALSVRCPTTTATATGAVPNTVAPKVHSRCFSRGNRIRDVVSSSWGQVVEDTNPAIDFPFAFTGREFDKETGLYYYRARYYAPQLGRFISEDPLGFAAGDTNLSRYVFNSPTNLTDPTGLESFGAWLARLLWPDLDDPADVARALNEEPAYVEQINQMLGTNYQKLAEISEEHRAYLEKVLNLPEDFNWDCVEQRLEVVGDREAAMDVAEGALKTSEVSVEAADAISGGVGGGAKAGVKKALKEGTDQFVKKARRRAGKAAIKFGAEAGDEAAESGVKAAGRRAAGTARCAPQGNGGIIGHRGFELGNHPLQPVRNSPATIGQRQLSGHAQVQNRGIPPSVVENTIQHGVPFPGNRSGTQGFHDPVNRVRVIINCDNGTVVTVMHGGG